MKLYRRKFALFMIALSLILLITPATSNPIPTTPWVEERDSIIGWLLYSGGHTGAGDVEYYPDNEVVVVTDRFVRLRDSIIEARAYARARLSSFTSTGFNWGQDPS